MPIAFTKRTAALWLGTACCALLVAAQPLEPGYQVASALTEVSGACLNSKW